MPEWLKKDSFSRLMWGLIIVVGLWWLYYHAGDKLLRPIAVRQIRELTAAEVVLKGVDFHLNGSIQINELVIKPPGPQQYDNTILKARKVYVRFKTASLLALKPRLKEITIENLLLNFQYDTDSGRWNVGYLKPPEAGRAPSEWPAVIVKKGAIRCSEVSNEMIEEILALDIKAEFSKAHNVEQMYNFSVATTNLANGRLSRLKGCWLPDERNELVLQGDISSLYLPVFYNHWNLSGLDVDIECDKDNIYVKKLNGRLGRATQISLSGALRDRKTKGSFEIKAKINDLLHTSEPTMNAFVYTGPLLEKLGPSIKTLFSRYNPNGLVDIELKASGRLDQLSEADCLGKVVCKDVSFCYEKFPYRIEHVTGCIYLTEDGAELNNLLGKHGNVDVVISGYSKNLGRNWDCLVRVTSENMLLDDDLYQALSSRQKKFWRVFSPGGAAQIDYRFVRRPSGQKKRTLAVRLLGGRASYRHFPYPLKNLSGRLFIEPGTVRFSDVTSRYDAREITIDGEVEGLGTDRPRYDIQISADHIPIDSTLKAALPEHQQRFYEQFEADGLINVRAEVFDSEAKTGTVEYLAEVALDAKRLSCGMLPFAVADVSGRAIITPDMLRIEELTGRYDSSSVSLSGKVWPHGQDDEEIGYCLLLRAEQLEINDELLGVLSDGPARALAQLQGQGRLNISAELNHNAVGDCPTYKVIVNCLGNSINFEKFSYPLKDLRGTLTITEEGVYLNDITALATGPVEPRKDTGTVKLNGRVELDGENFQTGQFSFSAQNVFFDKQLDAVLDSVVPNVYEDISPAGRFDLNVENLKLFKTDDGRDCIDFAGKVILKNCAFGPGQIITRLDGVLDTRWLYVEGLGLSSADVSLRAGDLEIKGRTLSDVKTEVHYAPEEGTWTARDFVADCYGGRVTADFKLQQLAEGNLSYVVRLGFEDIELKEFLMQRPGSEHRDHKYASGRMSGSLSVRGLSGDDSARTGRLRLSICDMQVGKLSILAKILSVLKLTAPGDFAFENMFIDSYIRQNQLLLERIDIQGRAFGLRGSGQMDLLSRQVDLHFTASGQRVVSEPSLLASLAEGLAAAVVEVKVTGHFDDPKIQTTTLPVIKHTLGILGSRNPKQD